MIEHRIGVDANRPIEVDPPRAGALSRTIDPQLFVDAGAHWVRINFVLGPWSSPDDKTRPAGLDWDWEGAYRSIVDAMYGRGLEIYALVGHETVNIGLDVARLFRRPPAEQSAGERADGERWIRAYADNFGRVVALFGDRIKVFESFNEPDNWVNGPPNIVHPAWFARMLQAVYDKVRVAMGRTDVTLVSGPLQGLYDNQNAAKDYLRATYAAGQRDLGWSKPGKPYPFDGVGYHLYLVPDFTTHWASHEQKVRRQYGEYVAGMLRTIRDAEGQSSPKRLYVSEIGWRSIHYTPAWLDFQARNVQLALEMTAADPAIALAIWFCTEDFMAGSDPHFYGLCRQGDVSPAGRKPAFAVFRDTCRRLTDAATVVATAYTNQDVLSAFGHAARQVGKTFFQLYQPTGLNALRLDLRRAERYTGPAIDTLPNLTDRERTLILDRLPGIQPSPAPAAPAALAEAGAPGSTPRSMAPVDDGLTGTAPSHLGKGVWIWQVDRLHAAFRAGDDHGLTPEEWLAGMAVEAGFNHVIVKVADGERPFPASGAAGTRVNAFIGALRAVGVGVWGWHHVYGLRPADIANHWSDLSPSRQAEVGAHQARYLGLDGLVVHASGDFKGQPGRAERYMDGLRAAMPELPLALSSFCFPSLHPTFPWEAFLERCDLNMPQVFWHRRDPVAALEQSLREHARHAHARPIVPVGAAHVMTGGIDATPEAIATFLDAARNRFELGGATVFRWETAIGTERWPAVAAFEWP